MAKRGRHPKITEEKVKRFCEAISNGMSIKHSSALIGVDQRSVFRWIALGRKGEGGKLYVNFVAKIAESEARFIEKNLQSVQRAAAPRKVRTTKTYTRADGSSTREVTEKIEYDWTAAWKLLECKDRESFGPDRHEIAALKADINELRKLLTEAIGKAGRAADDQAGGAVQPSDRAGVVGGGLGNPAAALPAGEPASGSVESSGGGSTAGG